jgi:hypothetical protein
MDDFRVGSVPPSEPYGDRHPYGSAARKRHKHHDGQEGHEQEEPADSFEASAEEEGPAATDSGEVEDFYIPSHPPAEEE